MYNVFYKYLEVNSFCKKIAMRLNDKYNEDLKDFEKLRTNYYTKFWNKLAEDMGASCENIHENYFRIKKGNKITFVNQSHLMIDSHLTLRMALDKWLTFKLIRELGYQELLPKYATFNLQSINKAYEFLEEVKGPIVIKPSQNGSGGCGVTTNITSKKQVTLASLYAAIDSKILQVEKQIDGDSYRLLYFRGEFLEAIKRSRPSIIGDGEKTIKELIQSENKTRLENEPVITISPLTCDIDHLFMLKKHGLKSSTILKKNQEIEVKGTCNQNQKKENLFLSDDINPTIIDQCGHIVKSMNINLAGVDLITPDITKPLAETQGVINEINTTPGLHYHYFVKNRETSPIGNVILEYLLK